MKCLWFLVIWLGTGHAVLCPDQVGPWGAASDPQGAGGLTQVARALCHSP